MVSVDELPELSRLILDRLAKDGTVPKDPPPVAIVSPATFWTKPWPIQSLTVTGTPNLTLVGGFFSDPSGARLRWIGVYRRTATGWEMVSLSGPGLATVPDVLSVAPEDIAATLQPILPTKVAPHA